MKVNTHSLVTVVILSVLSGTVQINLWEIIQLRAVTTFDSIEEFYHTLTLQKSGAYPLEPLEETKRTIIKKRICENIFSSHHFNMFGLDWLDIDRKEVRTELKNHFRQIFDYIFEGSDETEMFWNEDHVYENSYRRVQYEENAGLENRHEYFFVCLARNRQSREIETFLVTQEYNVTLFLPNLHPMAGRIVFKLGDGFRLEIQALAEESAVGFEFSRRSHLVELNYFKTRMSDFHAIGTPNQDAICRLSDANKLRLCASVLSEWSFRSKISFRPIHDSIQNNCQRKNVSFPASVWLIGVVMSLLTRWFVVNDVILEEWVIGCRVSEGRPAQPITYYVSRGDPRHSVYVYTEGANVHEIVLYNYFENVSVAGTTGDVDNDDEIENEEMEEDLQPFYDLVGDVNAIPEYHQTARGTSFLYNDVED